MSDESPKCAKCGATLEGRDVYEGTCKACREEAVLGAAARAPKPPTSRPAPQRPATPAAPDADAIAIEATVDNEADTKEIAGGVPRAPAHDDPVLAFHDGPAAPASAVELPTAAPQSPVQPAAEVAGFRLKEEPRPEPSKPEPPAPQPPAPAPTPPAEPELVLVLDEASAKAPDSAQKQPEWRAEPAAAQAAAPAPRATQPAPSPAPVAPAAPALELRADQVEGRLQALLDELAAQVEQLSRVLSSARQAAPSPVWFGFRACFGFVLGLGALALVAIALLALVGLLFYPPAFELLRNLFGRLAPPR